MKPISQQTTRVSLTYMGKHRVVQEVFPEGEPLHFSLTAKMLRLLAIISVRAQHSKQACSREGGAVRPAIPESIS